MRAGITPEHSRNRWLREVAARILLVAVPCAVASLPLGALSLAAVPLTVLGLAAATLVPPSPLTPAARRCLRTPPARSREPRLLATLERP